MDLGDAVTAAAKFSKGGSGKLWLVGDRDNRSVVGRRGVSLLYVGTELPDGVVALDAVECLGLRSTLEGLGAQPTLACSDRRALFTGAKSEVALGLLDPSDLPSPPNLVGLAWARVPAHLFEAAVRVAAAGAAETANDRPGLATVKLGPEFVEATDEVLVARSPSPLVFAARVPADLLALLPRAKETDVYAAELGGGVALATGDPVRPRALLVVDGSALKGTWFPDLRGVWGEADKVEALEVEVARTELTRAVTAAAKGLEVDIVTVKTLEASLRVGGGAASTAVAAVGSEPGQEIMLRAAALKAALAKGGKKVTLRFRGPSWPLEVSERLPEGEVRVLVFPCSRSAA